jgi:hypothetical protein
VRLPAGDVVFDLEDPGASALCPAIARQRVYDLSTTTTYTLELAAPPGGALRLVIGETHPAVFELGDAVRAWPGGRRG